MQKISILFAIVLSACLIACGGSTKAPETETAPEVTPTVEVIAPADTMSLSTALAKYESTVKKLIPALLDMQKGKSAAIKEYQALNKEVNEIMPVLQKKAGEMTEKEAKKYKEIADKLYQATNPNAPAPAKKK